ATISFSPPFGYALAARRLTHKDTDSLDLSAWRVAGVGAEMIHQEWLDASARPLAPAGFSRKAFLPCHGMAGCALGVASSPVGAGTHLAYIDGERVSYTAEAPLLSNDDSGRRKGFVMCGRPPPGLEAEMRHERGRVLAERHVGRISLRSPRLMQGY